MAKALTAASVDKIKPGGKRAEVPDGLLRGLYLIVQPSGAKSWAVRYRIGKRTQKLTIGPHPAFSLADAREAARAAIHVVQKGGDPAVDKRRARNEAGRRDDLFPTVARDYIARFQKPKNKSWAGTARLLGLKPDPQKPDAAEDPLQFIVAPDGPANEWAKRRIGTITRREIRDYIDLLATRVPIGANHTLAALKRMLKWAVERDIVETNAARDVAKPSTETHRDRVLTDDELIALLRASEKIGWPFGPWIKLLVLTGQRTDEVAGIRVDEVDRDRTTWTIPGPRAKNAKPHLVPVSRQVRSVLDALPTWNNDSGLLLTTTGRSPISGFSKTKVRVNTIMLQELRDMALDRGDDPKKVTLPEWRFHDIRRTMATRMPGLRVDLPVVEKILNHVSGSFGGVVAVYQRYSYDDEKRQALQAWADYVDRLMGKSQPSTIVHLSWARQ